jgi:nucleotide-binding universal stress UspA family protein
MVRGPSPFPRRFLIPTDGSPEAGAAARIGLRLAHALGASVRVISIVDPQLIYGRITIATLHQRLEAELLRKARTAVDAVARQARRLGVPCQTVVREGHVAKTILAEARAGRPGLIVLGTRGHTGLARLFLGSVATVVAPKAPCAVLLVPPGVQRGRQRKGA